MRTLTNSTDSNDGKFHVPIDKFRYPFKVISVARYSKDWRVSTHQNSGPNPTEEKPFIIYVNNPREQEIMIQFEHTSK